MAENKCRLCGGETNEKDAICRICKLFRKEELTALSVIPAKAGIISKKDSGQAGMTKKKDSGQAGVTKKKEKTMPEKKKYPKPKCEHEGCEKYVWRDRCCMIHYKEKHGIPRRVKKDKVSPPVIARSKATKQSKREIATPRSIGTRNDNKSNLGILAQMYIVRENKEKELARIDSAIETIKEFAEARA